MSDKTGKKLLVFGTNKYQLNNGVFKKISCFAKKSKPTEE